MKKVFGIVALCAIAASAIAVPARRDGMVRTMADGTEKTVYLNGDEHFHYLTDAEGNMLDEETLLPVSEEVKAARMSQGMQRVQARRVQQETGVDRLLSPRGPIILVSYKDKAFQQTNEDMQEWAMGENYTYNGATGSIRQYFLDQSWGQYDLQLDVFGPVTVSKNASYYGSNDYWGNDQHPDELVKEACQLAHDECGADFSQYDSNGDGKVDWVVILYAGKGEADGGGSSTIWPHQWELSYTGMSVTLDGKKVDHYCCLNEIDGQRNVRDGIGTFCHEFSHIMGLPDFYATDGSTHRTLGSWDIMDYGPYNNNGNTPPSYSAYERWWMGWMKPTFINSACSATLPELNETKAACYMTASGEVAITDILNPIPSTFYLFENRQKKGWDRYLKGNGMMVTKVQWSRSKWANNKVNNTSSSLGVDILEAKANTSYYNDKATDLYPAGATQFTKNTNFQVNNITMNSTTKVITFDVNGGGSNVTLDIERMEVNENQRATKMLIDGRVVILRDGILFDILGNRL